MQPEKFMSTANTSLSCAACGRLNLLGGVRCIYCGTHYPPTLEFDMGAADAPTSAPAVSSSASSAKRQGKAAGAASSLALLLLKAKSLFTLFKIGKIALTFSTMLISIWAYARLFKLPFAVGLVVCILIHELGHVFVNWRKGLKQTAPMFIPFVGAVIFIKQFPDEPTIEAESGAGGPFAGTLAALVCLWLGSSTGNPFWYALAGLGFAINLFNLAPFGQLDGAHIASVFSPQVWNGAMFVLLLVALKLPFYALWMVLGANLLARMSHNEAPTRYLLAAPMIGLRMAALYILLCVGLSWGLQQTGAYIGAENSVHPPQARTVSPPLTSVHPTRPANVASLAAPVPATSSRKALSPAARALGHTLFYVVVGILIAAACGVWVLVAWLLCKAANEAMRTRSLVLPGLMFGLFLILTFVPLPFKTGRVEMIASGAYFVAAFAALACAAHQAYRQTSTGYRVRLAPVALLARCLGWASGGAMLVAYTFNSAFVAAAVAAMMLAFYARFRWMPLCVAAGWAESLGDHARALDLLHHAVIRTPDSDTLARIWMRIARLNLLNDRGEATLQALDARAAIAQPRGNDLQAAVVSLSELEIRSASLMLLDRGDEALVCCEQMLQGGPDDRLGPLRLLTVHMRLSRLALLRGWHDEATAQAAWCIIAARKMSAAYRTRLLTTQAFALAAQGNAAGARSASQQALKGARDPHSQAMAALVAAQLLLNEGSAQAAERETTRALRLLPDSLPCRYWHGCALVALGQEAGREQLHTLATQFPKEYWGREAANDLAPVLP